VAPCGRKAQPTGLAPVTAGTARRRSRPAAPVVAAWSLGVLIILLFAADGPLTASARKGFNSGIAALA